MRIVLLALSLLSVFVCGAEVRQQSLVCVADSVTEEPVGDAFVYDRRGKLIGYTSAKGLLPQVSLSDYPLTVSCMGYESVTITSDMKGMVLLQEKFLELPEVVVNPKDRDVLHMMAYVREFSTLTTYTDTVFLFREKMVDFMLPTKKVKRFKGWTYPRVLASRSYYRFTNAEGMDSVSDCCSTHFSWSDWVELPRVVRLSERCRQPGMVVDTVRGRCAPSQIWLRNGEFVRLKVDALADTLNRKWVRKLADFHMGDGGTDFYRVEVNYDFEEVSADSVTAEQLSGYAFNIESVGRGRGLSHLFKGNDKVYIETKAEVYIADRRYLSLKEARRLDKQPPCIAASEIVPPGQVPECGADVAVLVARVDGIDRDKIRRDIVPDARLGGIEDLFKTRRNSWQQFWDIICPPRYSIGVSTYPGSH